MRAHFFCIFIYYFFLFQQDGWTTDDLIYKWKDDEPVQIVKDLNLPRFKLEEYSTDYCNTVTNTGLYSVTKMYFVNFQ